MSDRMSFPPQHQPRPTGPSWLAGTLLVGLVGCGSGRSTEDSTGRSPPQLTFKSATVLDRRCERLGGERVKDSRRKALKRKIPQLQGLWDAAGPPLLQGAIDEVGVHPGRMEYSVSLSLCDELGSMSEPLVVSTRGLFDEPPPSDAEPRFIEKTFHEFLHVYLGEIHADYGALEWSFIEGPHDYGEVTKYHLPLMAIEQRVYEKTQQPERLRRQVSHNFRLNADGTYAAPDYARARTLVQDHGPERFITELERALEER